jgi:non-heme chloroperoxidase
MQHLANDQHFQSNDSLGQSWIDLVAHLQSRGHALTIDRGWRQVAETALTFVKRFTQ